MASFIINPVAVPVNVGTAIYLIGVGTVWNSAPPVLSSSVGGTFGPITVVDNTHCNFTYTSPAIDQTDTISDATSGYSIALIISSNATLMSCVNWVQNDVLKRVDMQSALIDAVTNFYATLVRYIPFDEFMYTTGEYNCIQRQISYNTIGLQPPIWPPLDAISSLRMTYGAQGSSSTSSLRLRRSNTRLYDAISYTNSPSRPSTYARWGTSVEFNPPPDSSSYTFRFRYRGKAVLNAVNPENTIILIDAAWNELIKWELLYRAYYYLDMPEKALGLVGTPYPIQPNPGRKARVFNTGIIPRLWNDLLATISMKEAPDEDFSINPVVRNYSQQM